MSNRGLDRLLRSGGLTDFHVGRDAAAAVSRRGNPHTMFSGETYRGRFSMNKAKDAEGYKKEHAFEKKENREGKSEKRKKSDDDSGSESDGEGGGGGGKKRIYKKGEDADGDGKTNETKKVTDFSDKNKNGKPDAFEKKKNKD